MFTVCVRGVRFVLSVRLVETCRQMASFSFGFMALLTVSVTRASHGAAGPMTGQQLVAVLVNDLQIVSERRVLVRRHVGKADEADERIIGTLGISCALVNDDEAAAGDSVDNVDARRVQISPEMRTYLLSQTGDAVSREHRLIMSIGLCSALDRIRLHVAAARGADRYHDRALVPNALNTRRAAQRSLDASSGAHRRALG